MHKHLFQQIDVLYFPLAGGSGAGQGPGGGAGVRGFGLSIHNTLLPYSVGCMGMCKFG